MTPFILSFMKNETVLSVAVILAAVSTFFVPVDSQYLHYIDFRTLALLYCLMTVIAGIRRRGVFSIIAGNLVRKSRRTSDTVAILVLASFFLSMLITNDVSLITLVPLTLTCFDQLPAEEQRHWLIPAVVLETIAANLGSMATPIGNPQNLYLYGLSDLSLPDFFRIILPYSAASLVLLLLWIRVQSGRSAASSGSPASSAESAAFDENIAPSADSAAFAKDIAPSSESAAVTEPRSIAAYCALFLLCLTTVARITPWPVPLAAVLIYVLLFDRKTVSEVDYSLLGTFLALFVFIGNLGRIAVFRSALSSILTGHEVFTAIAASQVMSNVPAAILLSGFTSDLKSLIIGTNLGGLGTLIASMASLISYKLITKGDRVSRGQYLLYFTGANLLFLVCLILLHLMIR